MLRGPGGGRSEEEGAQPPAEMSEDDLVARAGADMHGSCDAKDNSLTSQPVEGDGKGPSRGQFFDESRPVAAPTRPFTRRMRDESLMKGKPLDRGSTPARNIVYVDHTHVHHHHHFHGPSAGGGPGSIPPEGDRQALEAAAETDAERSRGPALVGAAKSRNSARRVEARSTGGSRSARSAHSGTASSWNNRHTSRSMTPPDADRIYTPESFFSRDPPCWPAGIMSSSTSSAVRTSTGGYGADAGTKQSLPLGEYLSLISQLSPESRLKFSPYGVPRSKYNTTSGDACNTSLLEGWRSLGIP